MYRVEWRPPAVDELADFWISADPPTRAMLTAAAAEIDRKLSENPHAVGESRELGERIDFVYPLSYTFRVDGASQMVVVLHVRVYHQRRS